MKNILGKKEYLILFNRNGKKVYDYYVDSDDYSWETTYDEKSNKLTYKNSNGFSWERTYDSNSNELTYKDSSGVTRGFDIPKYTMEELVAKLGHQFRIKK